MNVHTIVGQSLLKKAPRFSPPPYLPFSSTDDLGVVAYAMMTGTANFRNHFFPTHCVMMFYSDVQLYLCEF
jgi:hypothetical protein